MSLEIIHLCLKGAKTILREDIFFIKWCLEVYRYTCKILKSNPYLIPHIKFNSKCIYTLNVRAKTVKCLEENVGVSLYELVLSTAFLNKYHSKHM